MRGRGFATPKEPSHPDLLPRDLRPSPLNWEEKEQEVRNIKTRKQVGDLAKYHAPKFTCSRCVPVLKPLLRKNRIKNLDTLVFLLVQRSQLIRGNSWLSGQSCQSIGNHR